MRLLLSILFIIAGGAFFGVAGLAAAGVATGWMLSSRLRSFFISGAAAALFWIIVAVFQTVGGQSQQLLSLAASLAQLSGARIWLLVLVSSSIAFLAGGLGGWLGGSLRQVIHPAAQPDPSAL
jgi:hypothetical protein